MDTFTKQPTEVLDYDVDFSDWMPSGDTISSALCTAEDGITLGATSVNASTSVVRQWLSGGTDGSAYKVTMTIVTTGGRTKQQEFRVKVKEI